MLGLRRAALRLVLSVMSLAVAAGLLAGLGLGGLAWTAARAPQDVTALFRLAAPLLPPGLTLGSATVALAGSPGPPVLRLAVADASYAAPGQPVQSVRHASLDLALAPLLEGKVVIPDIAIDGPAIAVPQDASSAPPSSAVDPAALRRWLAPVRHVTVTGGTVETGAPGKTLTASALTADLSQEGGTIVGKLSTALTAEGATVQATLDGRVGAGGGQITFDIPALNPASLAGLAPDAARLDAVIALSGSVRLGPAYAVLEGQVHALAGPGTLTLPADRGGDASPVGFAAASLDVEASPSAATLRQLRVVLQPAPAIPPTTLSLTGDATRADGRFRAKLDIRADRVPFAHLPALWPKGVGGNARRWLTENITAGVAHDGRARVTITGNEDGSDIDLPEATGGLVGDDLTVWWLRPVPPITHGHAVVAWVNPDVIDITQVTGEDSGMRVRNGRVKIEGLGQTRQVATIDTALVGSVSDTLRLLANPRLRLLSTHKLPFTDPSGSVAATLSVTLPLEDAVTVDDVAIRAHLRLARVHLGDVAAGQAVDGGAFDLDVTNDGLSLNGSGTMAGLRAGVSAKMDFRAGPPSQVLEQAHVTTVLTPAAADRAGAAAVGLQAGSVPATVDYAGHRDGRSDVRVRADLTPGRFETPVGWSKAAGLPGSADIHLDLRRGRMDALSAHIEAPDLSVVVASEFAAGHPTIVRLTRGEIGRTSVTGTAVLPQHEGEPYRIDIAGPRLDLEGPLASKGGGAQPSRLPTKPGPPFVLDLRFGRVTFGPNSGLGPVELSARNDGLHTTLAKLTTGGTERARVEVDWKPGGRALHLEVGDLGALLRETALATDLAGGSLKLDGAFKDNEPGQPFAGTVDLASFRVLGAPILGKVLQGATIYGLVDALQGRGLVFARMVAPFQLQGDILTVQDARAYSASLGFTASGRFDFGHSTVDLSGTLVPAYFLNALPGRIPLVGRLFSAEKGSGLLAMRFGLRGPIDSPSVSVNPLSLLTPGILRDVFGLLP